jgi:hypothetical protein
LHVFFSPPSAKQLWISLNTIHLILKAYSSDKAELEWWHPLISIHCKDLQCVACSLYTFMAHTEAQTKLLGVNLEDLNN